MQCHSMAVVLKLLTETICPVALRLAQKPTHGRLCRYLNLNGPKFRPQPAQKQMLVGKPNGCESASQKRKRGRFRISGDVSFFLLDRADAFVASGVTLVSVAFAPSPLPECPRPGAF